MNLGLHQPDVSVVWDLGPHDFSILRYWLGETPTHVSRAQRAAASSRTSRTSRSSTSSSPSGTIAHVELSWLAPSKLRRTTVVGSQKMVVYDDTSTEPVRIFDSGVDAARPGDLRRVPADLPDRRHRLAARRGGRAAVRSSSTTSARAIRDGHDAALLGRARPRRRAHDRGRDRSLSANGAPVALQQPSVAAVEAALEHPATVRAARQERQPEATADETAAN